MRCLLPFLRAAVTMALVFPGKTKCPLCGLAVGRQHELVATTAFLGPEHPLWRYSDAAMHRSCFADWEHRGEFVAAFNSVMRAVVAGDGTRRQMLEDGGIQVEVIDPDLMARAQARLAEIERAREASLVAGAEADAQWRGRPRACPRCGTRFVSVQDKGACPSCRHVFHASEDDGPQDVR